MPYVRMQHDVDPKDKLLGELGDIDGYSIFHNQVLVAVYIRPETAASGLILTGKTLDEDRYQSKVGLVIKMGPAAFVPTGEWNWQHEIKVNDWVVFRPSDGWNQTVNGVLCRALDDTLIRGVVNDPDLVY